MYFFHIYFNIIIATKAIFKSPFYEAPVFPSRKVHMPAERFRRCLLTSDVFLVICALPATRIHLSLPLSRNSSDRSDFQNEGRRHSLCRFGSFSLRSNKTYYNIDQARPYLALNCTRNCERCYPVSGIRARSRVCALLLTADCCHVISVITTFTREGHVTVS